MGDKRRKKYGLMNSYPKERCKGVKQQMILSCQFDQQHKSHVGSFLFLFAPCIPLIEGDRATQHLFYPFSFSFTFLSFLSLINLATFLSRPCGSPENSLHLQRLSESPRSKNSHLLRQTRNKSQPRPKNIRFYQQKINISSSNNNNKNNNLNLWHQQHLLSKQLQLQQQ